MLTGNTAQTTPLRQSGVMGGLEEIGERMGKWLMFSIVVPAGTISALRGSDALAKAIMDEFGSKDTKAIIQIGTLQETKFGPVIMLALALVCLCGSVMQVVVLVIRDLVLPIVLGLTPLFHNTVVVLERDGWTFGAKSRIPWRPARRRGASARRGPSACTSWTWMGHGAAGPPTTG